MGCGASKQEEPNKYSEPSPKPVDPKPAAAKPKPTSIKHLAALTVARPFLAVSDAPPAIPDGTYYFNKTVFRVGEPIIFYYNLTSMTGPNGYGTCQMFLEQWAGTPRTAPKWFNIPTQTGVQTQLFTFSQTYRLNPSAQYSLMFTELYGQQERMLDFSTTWVDGWESIGTGYTNLTVAEYDQIFATDASGNIMMYQGLPAWVKIGDPVYKMVGNHDSLFTIPTTKDKVMAYDLETETWSQVGGAIALDKLVATHTYLFGLTAAGNTYYYTGTAWQDLGQQLSVLIASDDFRVCGLSLDKTQVLHYQGTPGQWMAMGNVPMTNLLAANNAMYGIDGSGNIQRWDGTSSTWTVIGVAGTYVTRHNALFQVASDGVYVFTGLPNQWIQMCGQIDTLAVGENFLFGTRGTNVMMFEYDAQIPEVDPPQPLTSAVTTFSNSRAPLRAPTLLGTATTTVNTKWVFTFQTLDEVRAGYDGDVQFWVNDATTYRGKMTPLPTTHFERGHRYTWQLDLGPTIGALLNLGIASASNFWGDQWHLGTITAYCEQTGVLYTFNFNGQVPLLPDSQFNLVQVTSTGDLYGTMVTPTVVTPPRPTSPMASIKIWSYRGLTEAVGHASLALSDGTYISWWPSGYNRKTIPFIKLTFNAEANHDQTYADDSSLEEQDADFNVPIYIPNEAAVKTWWTGFNVTGRYWNAITQNCSTVVYDALKQGNALYHLTPGQQRAYDGIVTWTPNDVLSLANDIMTVG